MAKFNDWCMASEPNTVSVTGGAEKNPKKITMTRLGSVLGLNHWKTPFQSWCEICRVAELPFKGNKYTEAGQVIEPKAIEYSKTVISPNIKDPDEYYGKNMSCVWDFYKNEPIFGGKWDGIVISRQGKDIGIVEIKTTSRAQDWIDGVPPHYAIQALGYAALSGLSTAWVVVCFLEPDDYDNPEAFICTDDNTRVFELDVDTYTFDGYNIRQCMAIASEWWSNHVLGNQSPAYDVKKDKEFLDIMRTADTNFDKVSAPDNNKPIEELNISELAAKATELFDFITEIQTEHLIPQYEADLKVVTTALKKALDAQLSGSYKTKITCPGWVYAQNKTKLSFDTESYLRDNAIELEDSPYAIEKPGSWVLKRKKD